MHTAEHILNQTMIRMFGCERSKNTHIERKKSKCDYILCIMSCEVSSKSSAVDSLQEMSSLIYSYFMNRDTSKVSRQVEATAKETD